jgi:hypothetical protein
MANKKNEEVTGPEFRVGEVVFSVLSGGQKLTVKKVVAPKSAQGITSYMVAPQKGESYRASEGELQLTSPYAPKVRRQFNDYDDDNRNEDFGESPMGQIPNEE